MLLAKGLFHAALPLALALAGGGFMAQAARGQQQTADNYALASHGVQHALLANQQPESNAPRSSGEIACWQRTDRSVRDSEVAEDYQGNIYVQDSKTGHLRVLKLDAGFRLDDEHSDWMSSKLTDGTSSAEHLP